MSILSVKADNIGKDNVLNLFMLSYGWLIKFDFFLSKSLGRRRRKESGGRFYQGDYGCAEWK